MRKLRMGMAGGGPGAFIGPVHRSAAELDGRIELVAGAFSSDAERSAAAGRGYRVAPDRAYPDLHAMLKGEAARPDRIDFLSIVTPNHLHAAAADAALRAGFAVVSDKPATATLAEARALSRAVSQTGRPYALTYVYTGYPLVRHARALVAGGALGAVRKVVVEYFQGWLATPLENEGNRQAGWRVDPARAGSGGCIGDIGVHAFNLAEFVSGARVTRLLADLAAVVPGRALDDDAAVLLRFDNGARGALLASQVATGMMNGLRLLVHGEQASLEWAQESPDTLAIHHPDARTELLRAGGGGLSLAARAATRLPAGHPEGFIEAFANIYRDFAAWLSEGGRNDALQGIDEGVRGMAFVEAAVSASRGQLGWTDLKV